MEEMTERIVENTKSFWNELLKNRKELIVVGLERDKFGLWKHYRIYVLTPDYKFIPLVPELKEEDLKALIKMEEKEIDKFYKKLAKRLPFMKFTKERNFVFESNVIGSDRVLEVLDGISRFLGIDLKTIEDAKWLSW